MQAPTSNPAEQSSELRTPGGPQNPATKWPEDYDFPEQLSEDWDPAADIDEGD